MKKFIIVLCCLILLGSLTTQAKVQEYVLAQAKNSVRFEIVENDIPSYGYFTHFNKVNIFFDAHNLKDSRVNVSLLLYNKEKKATTVQTENMYVKRFIAAKEWLDSKTYPITHFNSTNIILNNTKTSKTYRYIAHGNLYVKGFSKPVTVYFNVMAGPEHPTYKVATGIFTFNRNIFQVGKGEWAQGVKELIKVSFYLLVKPTVLTPSS